MVCPAGSGTGHTCPPLLQALVSDPDAIEPLPDPRRITPQPASLDDPGKVVDVRDVVNRGRQGSTWAGEKLVLHKLRFHPDFSNTPH